MATTVSTRGLVLRSVDYSETSQIVSFFTRDEGIVDLLAKGSRRPIRASSSFSSPFDLSGWYDLVYRKRRGSLYLATEGRLIEGFSHLRGDLECWLDANLALEILGKAFTRGDPHPELLRGTLSYLKLLSVGKGRHLLRNRFLAEILLASGISTDWSRCCDCEIGDGVDLVALRVPSGPVCRDCRGVSDSPRDRATFSYLASNASIPFDRVPGWEVPADATADGWDLLRLLLLDHLERPPRSLRYLRA